MTEKILGINNNNDSIWFQIKFTINALDNLDKIFMIYETAFSSGERDDLITSEHWIKELPKEFFISTAVCTTYIIITKETIHVILRKTKRFEETKSAVLELFEFKKEAKNNLRK